MNRVLLVFPPHTRQALAGYQPIGLSYIASYIMHKEPEADVKLIDFAVEEFSANRWTQELRDFEPEIVGISVLTLNYPHAKLIAELTRKFNRSILISMGGVHATANPEDCLNYCDVVVRGEGEETFLEILQEHKWATIKGISYRKEGNSIHNELRPRIKDLDELPFPAYHLFKMERYAAPQGWGIMGARGCPYNCIFCCSPRMWNRIIKFRSANNIVDEIEYLHNKFGIQHINFFDDTINIPQRRAFDICDEIIRRGLNKRVRFECMIRANRQCVSLKLFTKMREANFVQIGVGIESGSQKVLNSIEKSLTPSEAREAVKLAHKSGISQVKGFFMVGNRDEQIRDVLKTWRFVLLNNVQPAFSICTPFPGSNLYQMLKEEGHINGELDWGNFNQSTPLLRTNKMSRLSIFTVYIFSILLQLVFSFTRGKNARHTVSRIVAYAWDMIWRRRK